MSSEEILVSRVSEWWIYVFNLTPFASNLSYIFLPGSTKVRMANTDPIWIRINNTERMDEGGGERGKE